MHVIIDKYEEGNDNKIIVFYVIIFFICAKKTNNIDR